MDPLSISTAVSGFAALSGQIISTLTGYVDSDQSIPDDIQSLLKEVKVFCQVLEDFGGFLRTDDLKGRIFEDSSVLRKAIEVCEYQLKELHGKLADISEAFSGTMNSTALVARMKWPLDEDELQKTVVGLRRLANIFQFWMTIKNDDLMSGTFPIVQSQLDDNQQEMEKIVTVMRSLSLSVPPDLQQRMSEIPKMKALLSELAEFKMTAIQTMPTNLKLAFANTITRIRKQKSERYHKAYEILKWIFLAQRPLTAMELRHALSVTIDHSEMLSGKLSIAYDQTLDWNKVPSEESLMDWGLGLVIIDEETSTIRLVHAALHDYLTVLYEEGEIFSDGHTEIAHTCLQYMMFHDYEDAIDAATPKVTQDIIHRRRMRFCFLDYATNNIGHHLSDTVPHTSDMIRALFPDTLDLRRISTGLRSIFLYTFYGWHEKYTCSEHEYDSAMQIHLRLQFAISCRLENVFFDLLDEFHQGLDLNTKLGSSTMLLQACRVGQARIVRILLESIVEINVRDSNGIPALSWASEKGHKSIVELLLQAEGIDVNLKDSFGRTAFSWASENGHESVVKLFLKAEGIDVNTKDNHGLTSLSRASMKGHESVVKLLLQAEGININLKDRSGRTALSRASANGHEAVVTQLLQAEGIDVNSKDCSGRSALSYAVENSHERTAKLLQQAERIDSPTAPPDVFDNGHRSIATLPIQTETSSINSKDDKGSAALIQACLEGQVSVVKALLLAKDMSINSKDDNGLTALSWASMKGHKSVVKLLLQAKDININSKDNHGGTPLSRASYNGHKSVVKLLLQAEDIDVNSRDNDGMTAFLRASLASREDVVRLLLQVKDIDINSKDNDGLTALSRACLDGDESLVKLLLRVECIDINSKDKYGLTALSWASENGHESVAKILLQAKDININSKDNHGGTPLSRASYNGHKSVVKLLLQAEDIDINIKDNLGRTALLRASYNGYGPVVKLLLQAEGIDINSKDNDGLTALSRASLDGHELIVKLLLQAEGIDVNSKNNKGLTALSLASTNKHESIVKLLNAAGAISKREPSIVGVHFRPKYRLRSKWYNQSVHHGPE